MIERSSGRRLGIVVALTVALAACGSAVGPDPNDVKFDDSLEIDLGSMTETPSGLFFRDDFVGLGEPAVAGDVVRLIFTAWLADGTLIGGAERTFTLGQGVLIDGVDEGVIGMRAGGPSRGGRRTLVIPADLAYGRQGTSFGVPGNAVLVYTLILVGLNESFDLTEVTPFWVTPKGIHILASSSPWRDGAQRAFVARSDLVYGMLGMFQTLLDPPHGARNSWRKRESPQDPRGHRAHPSAARESCQLPQARGRVPPRGQRFLRHHQG